MTHPASASFCYDTTVIDWSQTVCIKLDNVDMAGNLASGAPCRLHSDYIAARLCRPCIIGFLLTRPEPANDKTLLP
jgi:hypothetical protein